MATACFACLKKKEEEGAGARTGQGKVQWRRLAGFCCFRCQHQRLHAYTQADPRPTMAFCPLRNGRWRKSIVLFYARWTDNNGRRGCTLFNSLSFVLSSRLHRHQRSAGENQSEHNRCRRACQRQANVAAGRQAAIGDASSSRSRGP